MARCGLTEKEIADIAHYLEGMDDSLMDAIVAVGVSSQIDLVVLAEELEDYIKQCSSCHFWMVQNHMADNKCHLCWEK